MRERVARATNLKLGNSKMRHLGFVVLAALVVTGSRAVAAEPSPSSQATLSLVPRVHLGSLGPGFFLGAAPTEVRTTIFGLPQNIGPIERVLRGVVAATLLGIGTYRLVMNEGSVGWSAAFLAIAALPGATAATGYCPLYHALGIDWTF